LVALKNLDIIDNTTCQTINVINLIVTTTASVAIRSRGESLIQHGSSLWATSAISAIVCLSEIVMYAFACSLHVLGSSSSFRHINEQTLYNLVSTCQKHNLRADLIYGHIWVGEFAEICVCFVIALQDLATPVWTSQRLFLGTLAHFYGQRYVLVLAGLGIRLFFQVGVGWMLLVLTHALVPTDMAGVMRRLTSRPALVFSFGIIMCHPIAFWPYGQLCTDMPHRVLLFNECLLRPVRLDGQNACHPSFFWTHGAVEELMIQTNTTADDLGCRLCNASRPTSSQTGPDTKPLCFLTADHCQRLNPPPNRPKGAIPVTLYLD